MGVAYVAATIVAVGYPRKRTERTAGVEAIRLHCRGDFPHPDCIVRSVELRTRHGKRDYWAVTLRWAR